MESSPTFSAVYNYHPLVTCDAPATVKGLRSWIGAYKHVKSYIPNYSMFLSPLETIAAGSESKERILWTEGLDQIFLAAQTALANPKAITILLASDTDHNE